MSYPKRIGTETVWLSEAEVAEALQLTPDGNLRRRYWQQQAQTIVKRYAEQHGVGLVEDQVV